MPITATEVAEWIAANWDDSLTLREWWARLAAAGYSQPSWPHGLGGCSATNRESRIISDALTAAGAISGPTGIGSNMGGPTILEHGSESQKTVLLQIATGEQAWCQLFSEPDVGSDLAAVSTSAIRSMPDHDDYIVTGQKVWNSGADLADFGLLLARTDIDAPKHAGLSLFIIDMNQPGIEARALRTMNGDAQFCEVFVHEARVPVANMVGGLNNGWRVANTVLGHERRMASAGTARNLVTAPPGAKGGNLDRLASEIIAAARAKTATKPAAMISSAKTLIALARQFGVASDPVMRDELARYYTQSEVYRLTNLRARANAVSGRPPGPESSIGKLALSGMARTSRDLGLRIVGAGGMVIGPGSSSDGRVQHAALSAPGVSIGGGTDEIQHNVIGERALGLAREPAPFHSLTPDR